MTSLTAEKPQWSAAIGYSDAPLRDLGCARRNGLEARVNAGIWCGHYLARRSESRLRYGMVLRQELECHSVSVICRNRGRIEGSTVVLANLDNDCFILRKGSSQGKQNRNGRRKTHIDKECKGMGSDSRSDSIIGGLEKSSTARNCGRTETIKKISPKY